MKLLALLILSAVSVIALSSCAAGDDSNARKLPPITIGYQTTAGGHTIAAGYSSTAGIAVNVSDK